MIDYNKVLCPAIKEMKPSGIRKFFDIAQQLEGVISLALASLTSKLRGSYVRKLSQLWKKARPAIPQTRDL